MICIWFIVISPICIPNGYLSALSISSINTGFCDELTQSDPVHTAIKCLLDQGAVMGNSFIETVAAGEIIGIKPKPRQNPAGNVAAKAALTYHIDRLSWL